MPINVLQHGVMYTKQQSIVLQTGVCKKEKKILPVFLPFAGCPVRCVFCAQNIQTGLQAFSANALAEANSLENSWDTLKKMLEQREANRLSPVELAFYGGTFTALPPQWQERFLRLGQDFAASGVVTQMRCSTRPDAIQRRPLERLKNMGLQHIELGIQTFHQVALSTTRRAYTAEQCHEACDMVHAAGLQLGIQLLPAMPELAPADFLEDISHALVHQPETMRLYPCLVIKGTELAHWWEQGLYQPWDMPTTLHCLVKAMQAIWKTQTALIRIGLANTAELSANVLAGVYLPDLGNRVQADAFYTLVKEQFMECRSKTPEALFSLAVPRRFQGFFWGHQGELHSAWDALHINRDSLEWWDREYAEIGVYTVSNSV